MLLVAAVLALGWLFPLTLLGRWVTGLTVELPRELISRLTPGRLILLAGVLVAVAGLIAYARSEAAWLLGPAAPEAIGWVLAFDIGTYVDVFAAAALVAAALRLRSVVAFSRPLFAKAFRAFGHARSPRRRRERKPRSDAEDGFLGWMGAQRCSACSLTSS